jgi:hypothetical protein
MSHGERWQGERVRADRSAAADGKAGLFAPKHEKEFYKSLDPESLRLERTARLCFECAPALCEVNAREP